MKYGLSIAVLFMVIATAHAESMWVELAIVTKKGGWSYEVSGLVERKEFASDAALAAYLKDLSNPRDSIYLAIYSDRAIPIDQLVKILTMVKANPQGILVYRIDLENRRVVRPEPYKRLIEVRP